jgi:WhiB family redox-sensing transcriptional regulator
MDLEIFFHPDGERDPSRARRVARAKAICAECPVAAACRSWAHRVEEPSASGAGKGRTSVERCYDVDVRPTRSRPPEHDS